MPFDALFESDELRNVVTIGFDISLFVDVIDLNESTVNEQAIQNPMNFLIIEFIFSLLSDGYQ